MGTTEEALGDAVALTPSLFLGHEMPHLDHLLLERDTDVDVHCAVRWIQNGGTVLTPSAVIAMHVMFCLHIPVPEALDKLDRATHVLEGPIYVENHR
jgi:hypothetical protein